MLAINSDCIRTNNSFDKQFSNVLMDVGVLFEILHDNFISKRDLNFYTQV